MLLGITKYVKIIIPYQQKIYLKFYTFLEMILDLVNGLTVSNSYLKNQVI